MKAERLAMQCVFKLLEGDRPLRVVWELADVGAKMSLDLKLSIDFPRGPLTLSASALGVDLMRFAADLEELCETRQGGALLPDEDEMGYFRVGPIDREAEWIGISGQVYWYHTDFDYETDIETAVRLSPLEEQGLREGVLVAFQGVAMARADLPPLARLFRDFTLASGISLTPPPGGSLQSTES
jgi:hypothetical protein